MTPDEFENLGPDDVIFNLAHGPRAFLVLEKTDEKIVAMQMPISKIEIKNPTGWKVISKARQMIRVTTIEDLKKLDPK